MQQHETSQVTVSEASAVTEELAAAVVRLLPALSSSARPPTRDELVEMVASPVTTLLVARLAEPDPARGEETLASGDIVGMLTLVVFRIPTGVRAWIEDVVVDPAVGRRGIGTHLVGTALELARAAGARTVDLTSRPSRDVANRLYQRVGFARRDTTVYRCDLSG